MKKIVFSVFLALLPMTIQAQDKFASRLAAGYANVKTEVNLPSFSVNHSKGGHGFYADYMMERRFAERFAYMGRFGYVNAGNTYTSEKLQTEMSVNQGYASIVLGLAFYPLYDLSIFAGGYLNGSLHQSVKMSSTTQSSQALNSLTDKAKEEYKDLKKSDYGVRFGADYRIWEDLHIEAFYNLTLDKSNRQDHKNAKFKNQMFGAGLNYRF